MGHGLYTPTHHVTLLMASEVESDKHWVWGVNKINMKPL